MTRITDRDGLVKARYGYKNGRMLLSVLLIAALSMLLPVAVFAVGGSPVSGETKRVETTLDALAEMREDAEVVTTFQEGDHIFLTEETDDWYEVFYEGELLYIKKGSGSHGGVNAGTGKSGVGNTVRSGSNKKQSKPELSDVDTAELEKELQEEAAANEARAEVLEEYREAARRAGIWRTVIVIIVAGIVIAVVVSSVIRGRKRGAVDG